MPGGSNQSDSTLEMPMNGGPDQGASRTAALTL